MIRLEMLEEQADVSTLLKPKKKILELARATEGSMLKFQTLVKHSSEIDELATEFFSSKKVIDSIKIKSRNVSTDNMVGKLNKIKNLKVTSTEDFFI
jgi:hypothetical protein